MSQAEQDVQLKVWRELAISKQMLLRTAAEALKLDPECTQDELKAALELVLKKLAGADAEVAAARHEAKTSVAALENTLASKERELAAARKEAADAKAAYERVAQQVESQRVAAAAELQKVKERLAEREKALKAINVALADTPANVLQKMNTLKKQRQEEADARRQIDAALTAVRAEKRQLDRKVADLTKDGTALASRYRELHALSSTLRGQLETLVDDAASVAPLPDLDEALLRTFEQPPEKDARRGELRAVE